MRDPPNYVITAKGRLKPARPATFQRKERKQTKQPVIPETGHNAGLPGEGLMTEPYGFYLESE